MTNYTLSEKELTFSNWLSALDALFEYEFMLSYRDFPDYDWYNCFEDGLTVEEAFEEYKEEYDLQF